MIDDLQIREYKILDTTVLTDDELDGGSLIISNDAFSVVNHLINKTPVNNCMEWCSGPGLWGFSIFANKLCNNLTLVDIHEPNQIIVSKTIEKNNLQDRVNFILSGDFANVPGDKKYDLIIANPPHFCVDPYVAYYTEPRKYKDTDWQTHRNFFENVGKVLTDDGIIVLMENVWGSSPKTFEQMIEDNGLIITKHFNSMEFPKDIWYMEIKKYGNIIKRSNS
jgi:methylase of polypeptide subunit release factors